MATGTYEQYKERLLKVKPNVYLNETCMDRSNGKEGPERDLANWIKGGTYVMRRCYDVTNDPDYADVCIATSHITREKINRCTHIHHNQEDLLEKQLMTRLICHRAGGCMQHCMGTDAMNTLFSVTYDCDQTCGIEYHQRLLNCIEYCQKYDLVCNCVRTDVKGSRNPKYKYAHMRPDPGSFAHVMDMNVDGIGVDGKPCEDIIIHGARICNFNALYVDEIIANPTKLMGSDDADYAVTLALPGDWDDMKLMALPGLCHKRTHPEAPLAKISGVESLTIFDDCFVPYDRVSMYSRDDERVSRYASYLALMFAHYYCRSYIGCKTAASEVIASQAALIADANDTTRESHICEKLCDTIQTAELVLTAGEASAYHTIQLPSGQRVPGEALTNAGRRLAGRNVYHEYETLAGLTGDVCASPPTGESFPASEVAELRNKYIHHNPAYSAEDTHHVMRMMENKLYDSCEITQAVAGIHGGGSPLIGTITMMSRYDLGELKKITEYLVGIPGYGEYPRHEQSVHAATPRAMLVKFDAMAAAKKEAK